MLEGCLAVVGMSSLLSQHDDRGSRALDTDSIRTEPWLREGRGLYTLLWTEAA